MNNMETKIVGGCVVSAKQIDRDGVKLGVIEGYIATWDLDRGNWYGVKDKFEKGAFAKSLNDLRQRKRPIRLKDHHYRTVGGFPIEFCKEDDRGLFGVGEINLDVQQGLEVYMLAKQGVLSDFSIGFSVDRSTLDEQEDIRTIHEATVWEGSVVDEPMNPFANITAVKSLASQMAKDLGRPEQEIMAMLDSYQKGITRLTIEEFKKLDERGFEEMLKKSGLFSNNVCKVIAGKIAIMTAGIEPESRSEIPPAKDGISLRGPLDSIKQLTSELQKQNSSQ